MKNKPTIHYVVQNTFDSEEWSDVCSYDESHFELAKKAKDEFCNYSKNMEMNLKKRPDRVWPMIGVKAVQLIKRTTTEEVMELESF
jgi:hypothetical protein